MNRARTSTKSSMAGLDPAMEEFSPSPLLKVLC
jgi:hypothetical protein